MASAGEGNSFHGHSSDDDHDPAAQEPIWSTTAMEVNDPRLVALGRQREDEEEDEEDEEETDSQQELMFSTTAIEANDPRWDTMEADDPDWEDEPGEDDEDEDDDFFGESKLMSFIRLAINHFTDAEDGNIEFEVLIQNEEEEDDDDDDDDEQDGNRDADAGAERILGLLRGMLTEPVS